MKQYLTTVLILLVFAQCSKYEAVDFQNTKCKQAPSGEIDAKSMGDKRLNISLINQGKTLETEPIRVIWTVENKTITAFNLSYQFEKKGSQTITVKFYNRCLMEKVLTKTITVE